MPKNPHADFTPALEGYSGQGKFRFWCQMALPLTYDDSLSYYELLCKVVNYLNHTIEDVANAETNVSRLAEAYTQLQTYVNNYFDDLDVEAELRNVLDAMADDGTLNDLLDPLVQDHLPAVVDEQIDDVVADQIDDAVAGQIDDVVAEQLPPLVEEGIPGEVSDWLTENVDPVGSAVVVDSSLTISGAAADAKVTGDELTDLKTQLIYDTDTIKIEWQEDGKAIGADGTIIDNVSSFHYSNLIPVDLIRYYFKFECINDTQKYRIHGYDANGEWIEQIWYVDGANYIKNEKGSFTITNNSVKYIRISINNQAECSLSTYDNSQVNYNRTYKGIVWEYGAISNINGYEIYAATGLTYKEQRARTPDYIPNRKNINYIESSVFEIAVYVYNSNDTLVGIWNGTTTQGNVVWLKYIDVQKIYATVPNCKIKLVIRKNDNSVLSIYDIEKEVRIIDKYVRKINILFVGNSFTQDENSYLPALLKEADPGLEFHVGMLYHGNSTLDDHITHMNDDTAYETYSEYSWENNSWVNTSNVKLSDVINKYPWDIVSFTQANRGMINYATDLKADLLTLIDGYTSKIGNNVQFAMNFTHIYATNFDGPDHIPGTGHTSAEFYEQVAPNMERVLNELPVFDVFPTGTAIQNARTTTLDSLGESSYYDMTYDGRHLNEGICCMVPAYVMMLKIMELVGSKKTGIFASKILPTSTWITAQNIPGQHGTSQGATKANCLIAAKCAVMAVKHPFEITDCSAL